MFIHRRDDFIAMHGVEGNTNIITPLPGKKLYDFITGEKLPANPVVFKITVFQKPENFPLKLCGKTLL